MLFKKNLAKCPKNAATLFLCAKPRHSSQLTQAVPPLLSPYNNNLLTHSPFLLMALKPFILNFERMDWRLNKDASR